MPSPAKQDVLIKINKINVYKINETVVKSICLIILLC